MGRKTCPPERKSKAKQHTFTRVPWQKPKPTPLAQKDKGLNQKRIWR